MFIFPDECLQTDLSGLSLKINSYSIRSFYSPYHTQATDHHTLNTSKYNNDARRRRLFVREMRETTEEEKTPENGFRNMVEWGKARLEWSQPTFRRVNFV
jgi:hypothetical protein